MSEYWIPQAKKYCDFCKCWISDNKPSVQFHENGKKHKENVTKRLNEISRESAKNARKEAAIDREMKKMEQAAMKAYAQDVEASADITCIELQRKISAAAQAEKKNWLEAKANSGQKYYWNKLTGETTWDKPEESYIPLSEQSGETAPKPPTKASVSLMNQEIYHQPKYATIRPSSSSYGPEPRNTPYGSWETVKEEKYEPLQLDLPEQEFVPIKVLTVSEPREKGFKEKKLPAAGSVGSKNDEVGFKKRKFGGGAGRNMRQRLNDD